MTASRRTLIAFVAAAALGLAGCGGEDGDGASATPTPSTSPTTSESVSPTDSPTAAATQTTPEEGEPANQPVQVTIAGDSVTPVAETVEIGVGEPLEVEIDADRQGELHVHSTPEQTFQLSPGRQVVEMRFDKPGTVDVEEHVADVLVLRVLVS